ncbi:MAG: DUF4982 domain-containing protein [Planctomycetota bacterium]|nr:DUF4982 domain-containing protein [Planctomycetota bacterium]
MTSFDPDWQFTRGDATNAQDAAFDDKAWQTISVPNDWSIEVYSNCQSVELQLNGKSLGAQDKPADDSPRVWKVPFQAGSLKAIASNDGKAVATDELRTAGQPAKIILSADQDKLPADWNHVAFVRATVVDENGITVPSATEMVTFKLSGPGEIAAVDNGDPACHESFKSSQHSAYRGICYAIIRADSAAGPITLTATAPDLAPSSVTIATSDAPTAK